MPNNIEQLKEIVRVFNKDNVVISSKDLEDVLKSIVLMLANFKKGNEKLNKETKDYTEEVYKKILDAHEKMVSRSVLAGTDLKDKMVSDFGKQILELKDLIKKFQKMRPKDGDPGKDADEEKIITQILKRIKLPKTQKLILDTGEDMVRKINSLPIDDDDFKIDIAHIKNVPKGAGKAFGGARMLRLLNDFDKAIAPEDGFILKYNATTKLWYAAEETGGGGGSGLTKETPSGTINDANLTFTVAHEPFFINVNGGIYEVGDGAYASYSAGTITLAYPVGTGGFIKSYY